MRINDLDKLKINGPDGVRDNIVHFYGPVKR